MLPVAWPAGTAAALDPHISLRTTLATFDHLTLLSEQKDAFIDGLPLDTLNPLYRTINREFEVSRWLEASEEQVEWNKAVIKAGQWIPETDLAALRDSGKKPSNFYISLGRLMEDLLVRAWAG